MWVRFLQLDKCVNWYLITLCLYFQDTLECTQLNIEENIEKRGKWGSSLEFLMSCIAMNVGLGNIWRFPFVAYENGGGAFLIPYILVLIFLGRPMYYLEVCLGQFSGRGNVKMFQSIAPILKGEHSNISMITNKNAICRHRIWTTYWYLFCCYILLLTYGVNFVLFG